MITATVNISDVLKGLDTMGKDFVSAVAIALRKSAIIVFGKSKENAPIDTGRMVNAIYYNVEPLTASIISPVEYSIYVHEGTKYMKAQPFMRNALEEKRSEMMSIFENEIGKAVDKFNS